MVDEDYDENYDDDLGNSKEETKLQNNVHHLVSNSSHFFIYTHIATTVLTLKKKDSNHSKYYDKSCKKN